MPGHVCDPLAEPAPRTRPHDHAAVERADDAHGHGHGGHAGMSMDAMARDMRNRFLVALVFTIPIVLWSMVGTKLLGTELATPFGIDRDVWQFLLSLPVVLYASSIFFTGAVAALRNRTLDMMVLVAVAIGTGWLYSVAATFFIEGDVFYEAAGMLATFVLLGHWFEMRARGGANDAIRALLDLAPPKAVVLRDGEPVEVPTAEVSGRRPAAHPPRARRSRSTPSVEEGESQVDESTVTGESLPGQEDARRPAHRRDHQQERHAARPRDRGRLRHRARADRQARPGGAELQGARPAARRPRRVLARAGRARRRRA